AGALGLAAAAALLAERVRRRAAPGAVSISVHGVEALGTVSLSAYIAQSALYLALFPPYTLGLGATAGSALTAGIAAAGWLAMIPPHAFDVDHSGWPAAARDSLGGPCVNFAGDGELTRLLIASGLRIKLRDRPAARVLRSAERAATLGLEPVPRYLVVGLRG